MIEGASKQILLIAPDLLGETLSLQLTAKNKSIEVFLRQKYLTRHPSLVIWSIDSLELETTTRNEIKHIKEKWNPSPVLILLPPKLSLKPTQLLNFECEGILQDPDIELLNTSIDNLINGGRVIRLNDLLENDTPKNISLYNLGSWLLSNSLENINRELKRLEGISKSNTNNIFLLIATRGRKREVSLAKSLLIWFWSPIYMSLLTNNENTNNNKRFYSTNINISEKNSKAVWNEIYRRSKLAIESGIENNTGSIFAIQSLHHNKQKLLLTIILDQLNKVFNRLQEIEVNETNYIDNWSSLETELRKQVLRDICGTYNRITSNGELISVSDKLIAISDLTEKDEELPDPSIFLDSLILNKPILVEGNLLTSDDPRALINLETLIMNWILRTSELIGAELISACSDWPELREYLLKPKFFSTRELERLRNQLNSQRRWQYMIERPIQLYESKRQLFKLSNGKIEIFMVSEARDKDLKQLGWWQKQVTLLVEARDALAPQLQAMLKYFGDLMVIVLTNILGRAIGLVGKGIAQGMGRTISR
mgnify:CR=1 FL=1